MTQPPTVPDTRIRHARGEHEAPALELAFSDLPAALREMQVRQARQALQAEPPAGIVLEALRGRERVGAMWAHVLPGQTALVYPPRTVSPEFAVPLAQRMNDELAARRVQLAQASLEVTAEAEAQTLQRAGYQPAATLAYLAADAACGPVSLPDGPLTLRPIPSGQDKRLADILQKTYQQSQDTPAVDGLRDLQQVIDGYRQTGAHDRERWFVAQAAGEDVGCLLLTDHPGLQQWELIYMGLAPEARGRGGGLQMVRHAQWMLRSAAPRERLVLAVDEANRPALRVYESAGFRVWDRRRVLICSFPERDAAR